MLPIKKTITPKQAFKLMEEVYQDLEKEPLKIRDVYRYIELYEGVLSYKTTDYHWGVYEDIWINYLKFGFPDLAIKQPVMKLSVALRYLHACGIDPNYKLRELRRDLNERGMIIKGKNTQPDRVTRSNCNKFLGEWNGNR